MKNTHFIDEASPIKIERTYECYPSPGEGGNYPEDCVGVRIWIDHKLTDHFVFVDGDALMPEAGLPVSLDFFLAVEDYLRNNNLCDSPIKEVIVKNNPKLGPESNEVFISVITVPYYNKRIGDDKPDVLLLPDHVGDAHPTVPLIIGDKPMVISDDARDEGGEFAEENFRFDEDKTLNELLLYVEQTYSSHYAGSKYQATDIIIDSGHGVGFCIGNIMKYAKRYGKKGDQDEARKDILKILHYALILMHTHNQQGRGNNGN